MNVYNRSLFKDRANEARDALREMGGVGNKMPKGILASSPELMQAAMPARRPMAPMPMPRPASANLPPASPLPDIAGTQAVRQAQPGAVARPPVAQPMMQRPMPQGNPMSGSLQNKPGFHDGGPIGHLHGNDAFLSMQASMKTPKEPTSGGFKGFMDKAKEVYNFNPNRRSSATEGIPTNFNDLFKLGKDVLGDPSQSGPKVRGKTGEKQEAIRKKVLEAKKNPPPREELEAAASQAAPDTPKEVLAAAEVDELLNVIVGAEFAKAIAGNVTNSATGEVIRPTVGARFGNAAERAAKARLAVEMGREQNELDRQKAEAVARIQASAKGKPFLETNEAKLYQERWKSIREATGQNFEKAFAQMAIEMPETHERWIANVGVDASRQVLDAPASVLDFAKKRLSDPKTTEKQKQQVLKRLKELNVEFDETELLGGS